MKHLSSKLFKPGTYDHKLNVVFNWHGGRSQNELKYYAEAYHKAANKLVEEYGSTGATRDFEAAPIVFLYRHALELYLKAFILGGSSLLRLTGKVAMSQQEILNDHKLTRFIAPFEAIIKQIGWSWDMGVDGLRNKNDFVSLLSEFENVDSNSYTFRYPINKDGASSLPSHFSFDLYQFATQVDALLEILDGGLLGIAESLEAAYEMSRE